MTNEKQISTDQNSLNPQNESIKVREIYTDKEASDYLRISQITLWRERKAGKITFRRAASKIIYLQEDLDAYLEKNKRVAFAVI